MKTLFSILILQLAIVSASYGQSTPSETLEIWNVCYGTADMDRCGDITTANMRNNKPKSVWVYDSWKQLDAINYRKEKSEILKTQIDGDSAVIVAQVRIYALDGFVDQKELYKLIKDDRKWLIDDLIVVDEILEEQPENL